MEVSLPPANRVRFRASRGHEWLQSPAGALGQGPDADGKKNPPKGFEVGCALARQSRGLLPPHRQHQLPADDRAFHHVAARDDRALLPGLVPDAGDRPAALPRVHVFHLQLLSRLAKRTSAQDLVAHVSVHALRHGNWDWNFRPQRPGGDRSAARQEKRICPHAQIQYRRQAGYLHEKIIQEQSRLDAVRGGAARPVFLAHCRLRDLQRKLRHRPVPAALCLGLLVYGLHVPGPNVLRASPLRRQRPRNAPCNFRRSGLLALRSFGAVRDDRTNMSSRQPACEWAQSSLLIAARPGPQKNSGSSVGPALPEKYFTFFWNPSIRGRTARESARTGYSPGPPAASAHRFRDSQQHDRPDADH